MQRKVLMDMYYPLQVMERIKAEKMFAAFIADGFSYAEMKKYPDSMMFPSAHTLSVILVPLIKAVIAANDATFLQDGILMTIDPSGNGMPEIATRCHELKALFDHAASKEVCHFVSWMEADLEDEPERVARIREFWGCSPQ